MSKKKKLPAKAASKKKVVATKSRQRKPSKKTPIKKAAPKKTRAVKAPGKKKPATRATPESLRLAADGSDPIKHVVVLMFENHSFDQMLGCFKAQYPQLEGVDPANLRSNLDLAGRPYPQRQHDDPVVRPDPKHELEHVLNQIANGNSGFVSEYEKEYQASQPTTVEQRQKIMDYFGKGDLPALHALAENFTICDHWFSSVPGPTWTNRFFVHSGTSKGLVEMPEHVSQTNLYLHYDQDTIFDRLNEKKVKWRIYFGDLPQTLVFRHQQRPRNALRYRLIHSFLSDAQDGILPEYSFIEPCYQRGEQNDDHPPHATVRAQRLLAQVYNAIRGNKRLWESTLLVVLYDEHGGFYDHVEPPVGVPPDQHKEQYTFDRLGVRVPALLVSPWVDRTVLATQFDHTSLLKYLTEKWKLGPLTERVRQARNFGDAIRTTGEPRSDTPEKIPFPPLPARMMAAAAPGTAEATAEELAEPINSLQRSLMVFAEHLETSETDVPHRAMMMAAGPLSEEQLAKQRVAAFLEQQRKKAGVHEN